MMIAHTPVNEVAVACGGRPPPPRDRRRSPRRSAERDGGQAQRTQQVAVTFNPGVVVRDARPLHEDRDDKANDEKDDTPVNTWYSEEEERMMNFEVMNLVSALRMGMANALPDIDDTRGIEHLIDEDGRIRLNRRRRDVIEAVMAEQRRQRHGLFKRSVAEAWDSIARAASSHTAGARVEARQMAARDEAAVFGRRPLRSVSPAGETVGSSTTNSSRHRRGELLEEFRRSSASTQQKITSSPSTRVSFWTRARKSFYRSLKDEEEMTPATPAARSAHSRISLEKGGGTPRQQTTTATKKRQEQGSSHRRRGSSSSSSGSKQYGKTAVAASAHTRIRLEEALSGTAPEQQVSAAGRKGRGCSTAASSAHARIGLERGTDPAAEDDMERTQPQVWRPFGGSSHGRFSSNKGANEELNCSSGGGSGNSIRHFFFKKALRGSKHKRASGKENSGKSGGGGSAHCRVVPAVGPDFTS